MSQADYWCDTGPIECDRCKQPITIGEELFVAIPCEVRSATKYDREEMMEPKITHMGTETGASWFPLCITCVMPKKGEDDGR